MQQFEYTITDPNGLHARPAGLLVKKVQGMSGEFVMECRGKRADLKRLLAIMGMGIRCGDRVTVKSENASEGELHKLKNYFEENL
ncbi:MAG: HPr family phosphocarrier protein [Clostridia bacterium]|nr:HPr family phosphocarrier protein [Clostridia bacterium]